MEHYARLGMVGGVGYSPTFQVLLLPSFPMDYPQCPGTGAGKEDQSLTPLSSALSVMLHH